MPRVFLVLAIFALMCGHSPAQDEQSLGDLARQVRAQKQQKAAQGKDAGKTMKSVSEAGEISANDTAQNKATTEETLDHADAKPASPAHSDPKTSESGDSKPPDSTANPANREAQAENWRSQILQQKDTIAELQRQIEQASGSIHYAGANCVSNCEQWNEQQQHKQEQVDTMKSQLEELQHHLEEMQEAARKQGFGSSVYEP